MHTLFTVCTKQIRFPDTEHAASGWPPYKGRAVHLRLMPFLLMSISYPSDVTGELWNVIVSFLNIVVSCLLMTWIQSFDGVLLIQFEQKLNGVM